MKRVGAGRRGIVWEGGGGEGEEVEGYEEDFVEGAEEEEYGRGVSVFANELSCMTVNRRCNLPYWYNTG